MENLIELLVIILIIFGLMYMFGRAFQSDLDDLERKNPKYRKWLKDKYDI